MKKILLWGSIGVSLMVLCYLLALPNVSRLKTQNPKTTSLMQRRVRQAAEKGKKLKPVMVWRNLNQISPYMVRAVLLAEDDTFYQHHGFDLEQIVIAFKINWKKKRFAYGGSTLTQQLARTLYLSPSKNILRKLKEALITVWLEHSLPKRRILELYLNVAEWGDGIFGVEAASRHYFGKSSADLTPEEAVALASILPSPRKWSPLRTTRFMARRRSNLLSRMELHISTPAATPQQREEERSEIMEKAPSPDADDLPAPPSTDENSD